MGIGRRTEETTEDNVFDKKTVSSNSQKNYDEIYLPEEPKFSLEDIVLPSTIKEKILDVAEYAQNSRIVFETWGLEETHKYSRRIGINLYGAPGTGKTMASHAIAKHLGRKIIAVNYADIESKYVGETPKNIRRVFEVAQKTNSILFFDEADAILSRRVNNMSNATDVSVNQTRSVMLMLMNEFQDFIIFATNFIENFDPTLLQQDKIIDIQKAARFKSDGLIFKNANKNIVELPTNNFLQIKEIAEQGVKILLISNSWLNKINN